MFSYGAVCAAAYVGRAVSLLTLGGGTVLPSNITLPQTLQGIPCPVAAVSLQPLPLGSQPLWSEFPLLQ